MESIANFLSNGLKKLWGVFNPGYVLAITAIDIDEVAFNRVKEVIKDNGFIFVADRDNIHRGAIVSEYTRKRNYLISITLIHTDIKYPERRLDLKIRILNEYKGGKPIIKADIDELGTRLYDELSQFAGKNKLTLNKYRTIPDSV
jgi:hypothetical protein